LEGTTKVDWPGIAVEKNQVGRQKSEDERPENDPTKV
jgi:hypothetical protein